MMIKKTHHTVTTNCGDRLTIAVGDVVGFKCDVEQYGKIIDISRRGVGGALDVTITGNFVGGYIGGETVYTTDARDLWKDGTTETDIQR